MCVYMCVYYTCVCVCVECCTSRREGDKESNECEDQTSEIIRMELRVLNLDPLIWSESAANNRTQLSLEHNTVIIRHTQTHTFTHTHTHTNTQG